MLDKHKNLFITVDFIFALLPVTIAIYLFAAWLDIGQQLINDPKIGPGFGVIGALAFGVAFLEFLALTIPFFVFSLILSLLYLKKAGLLSKGWKVLFRITLVMQGLVLLFVCYILARTFVF